MDMEKIKSVIEDKEIAMTVPDGVHQPSYYLDQIEQYRTDPDEENGKSLPWSNVELTLKNELYLLTGIPSMGKSTWMDNIVVSSSEDHGYKWAVFSPESYPVKKYLAKLLWVKMNRHIHGRYSTHPPTQEEVAVAVKKLDKAVVVLDPPEKGKNIESLLESVEWLVKNKGVNAFLFDPYNEFSATRPSGQTETEYVSMFLGKIRTFINTNDVMAWIVAHPTKLKKSEVRYPDGTEAFDYDVPTAYDISGSSNFYNKPDNIITFHRNRDRITNPDSICQIRVQKARNGGDCQEGEYLLAYNYRTNSFDNHF